MGATTGDNTPIVEANPAGDRPETGILALQSRIRQQEMLAELGVTALQGASLDRLLVETVRLTAEGLDVEFCKLLEHIPSSNRLLVRAGVGWDAGVVGVATVGSDLDSSAGFALLTGKPVISNHLEKEERFHTSGLLRQHGIKRAMNVILQGDGRPFGALEVDSRSDGDFLEHDLAFLQGATNIVGMAIERERHERRLVAALERDQLLLKEMNQRVKNSLAIVVSMLNLQARDIANPELTGHLNEAANRIAPIGKAHDQLSYGSDIQRMDLGQYITAICKDRRERSEDFAAMRKSGRPNVSKTYGTSRSARSWPAGERLRSRLSPVFSAWRRTMRRAGPVASRKGETPGSAVGALKNKDFNQFSSSMMRFVPSTAQHGLKAMRIAHQTRTIQR